jgi:hypothetical protein
MAKGQLRSNKEKRKPKKDKTAKAPAVAPPRFSTTPVQIGGNQGGKKN